MDINRMTLKTQEAVQAAQNLALKRGHVEVDGEHLLLALLEQEGGLVPRLLQQIDVPVDNFATALRQELERRPSVAGPGVEAGKIYVTQRFNRLLVQAEEEARRLKDEYVSRRASAARPDAKRSDTAAGTLFDSSTSAAIACCRR